MKVISIILLSIFVTHCKAQTNNLETIRKVYLKSAESEESAIQLINICGKNQDNSIIYAYKTVAELMLIEYKYNPLTKLKLFAEKTKQLDLIVSDNLNNIEIRFLRLCIQKQTPKFLDYNSNIKLDYTFIIKNIDIQSQELQEYINSTLKKIELDMH